MEDASLDTTTAPVLTSESGSLADKPVKLNIGAGGTVIEGYTPLDIKTGTDAGAALPYADSSVDEIYASHVLEHFPYEQVGKILKEWARVLKPGGLMRIAVPDFDRLCKDRTQANRAYLDRVVMGGHIDQHDHHKAVFDPDTLREAMGSAGIGNVGKFEPFAADTSRHPYSLNLEGNKRWWPRIDKPRLSLVLCQPRFCFSGHSQRWTETAYKLGQDPRVSAFQVQPSFGAFWDRDITGATMTAMAVANPDFLIYSDYDSYFDPEDLFALVEEVNGDPTLAAAGCVQLSRHDDHPLVLNPTLDYSGKTTDVMFSHFGLTIIRRAVFDELPQPWFWSTPGADGSWHSYPRSDADITFWRIMREHGFRVVQRNDICIGHGVWCVKWPRMGGKGVLLQPEEMYFKKGKPAEVGFDHELHKKLLLEEWARAQAAAQATTASSTTAGGGGDAPPVVSSAPPESPEPGKGTA